MDHQKERPGRERPVSRRRLVRAGLPLLVGALVSAACSVGRFLPGAAPAPSPTPTAQPAPRQTPVPPRPQPSPTPTGPRTRLPPFLDNGLIRIGVDLARGGSISYLADTRDSANIVNIHDLGRYIGPSFYAGPQPFGEAHPDWRGWPWNPVSAGDVYGNPAEVLEYHNDGTTLYVKSAPLQWALRRVAGECTFETWITLDGRAARVRHRLTNQRPEHPQYAAMDQELPAVYTVARLHRLVTYTGSAPFTGAPTTEIPKQPSPNGELKWSRFYATEHWAALVDDSGWGLGVVHPGVYQFWGGFHGQPGAGRPQDDATGYIAPVRREVLDHDIEYEYSYALILDTVQNIRRWAYAHRPPPGLPDYRFERDRQHWWYVNAEDGGYPIEGMLRVKLHRDDPQMIGPDVLWEAGRVPRLYIRAAFHTRSNLAEIFWKTWDSPFFSADKRVTFRVVNDGQFRTYAVDLSRVPAYHGLITGLRFDPVETGRPWEYMELVAISADPTSLMPHICLSSTARPAGHYPCLIR
jgi:hypothetical protein